MNRNIFLKTMGLIAFGLSWVGKAAAASMPVSRISKQNLDSFFAKTKIFKTNTPAQIEINLPENFKNKLDVLGIVCYGDDGSKYFDGKTLSRKKTYLPFKIDGNKIVIEASFPKEQKYAFYIVEKTTAKRDPQKGIVRVYALEEDLFNMRAFKGDTHMHSTGSDGKNTPEEMAVRCLEVGYDFMALSDHNNYNSGQAIKEKCEDLPMSIRIINGEECHQSHPHVHSFGANQSVTKYIKSNQDKFKKLVYEKLKTITQILPDDEKEMVARAEAEFDIIRSFGGLSSFNHPYWRANSRNDSLHLPNSVIEAICSRGKFDTIEIVNGGCSDNSTDMAIRQYSEIRSKGLDPAIIGNTDAHKVETLGKAYTIVFAKSSNFEDLKNSILQHKNVVVDAPNPEYIQTFGKTRFMQYAWFLISDYFPSREKIFAEESNILKKILKEGRTDALIKELEEKSKVSNSYTETFWQNLS